MGMLGSFRTMVHREPIIMWSFIIGGIGLALPIVVPPVRESLGYGQPTPKNPPPIRQLIENAAAATK
ncbi:hypothetical protein Ndes2437B_g07398 [Nannochloris sp. 'desiccata']